MISEVVMPQMGADMKEGTILRWLKQEGEDVARGEIIAEIETDKANVEIESFEAGVFRKALHGEGDVVPVFEVIALIGDPSEDISKYEGAAPSGGAAPAAGTASAEKPPADAPASMESQAGAPSSAPEEAPTELAAPPTSQPTGTSTATRTAAPPAPATANGRLRASPVARRLAEEFGIDIAGVRGTGPDGRILRRDVEAAREAAPTAAAAAAPTPQIARAPAGQDVVQDVQISRMRQTIARRTQQAKQQVPHYYLGIEIDMTEALKLRISLNESLGERGRISVNDVILLATARTLAMHPKFNAFWVDDHVQLHSQINVGIAVAMEDGLVAPAIMDVGNKGLLQVSEEARDVASRARSGNLRPEEYTAATFNVSNGGVFGIDELVAIITQPQVGVLGVGVTRDKPVVRDGEIVVRSMMYVTLSADHRATDGADGAKFLATLKQMLESPGMMLL
jgi:pyruvate dehydrogenase E2 component (dihydrolipoamide acetyltransferase)